MRRGGAIARASFARRPRRAAVLVLEDPHRQSARCITETRSQISSSPFPVLDLRITAPGQHQLVRVVFGGVLEVFGAAGVRWSGRWDSNPRPLEPHSLRPTSSDRRRLSTRRDLPDSEAATYSSPVILFGEKSRMASSGDSRFLFTASSAPGTPIESDSFTSSAAERYPTTGFRTVPSAAERAA
jgi:hypothetical protein